MSADIQRQSFTLSLISAQANVFQSTDYNLLKHSLCTQKYQWMNKNYTTTWRMKTLILWNKKSLSNTVQIKQFTNSVHHILSYYRDGLLDQWLKNIYACMSHFRVSSYQCMPNRKGGRFMKKVWSLHKNSSLSMWSSYKEWPMEQEFRFTRYLRVLLLL